MKKLFTTLLIMVAALTLPWIPVAVWACTINESMETRLPFDSVAL
ncbi:MAG: hypothetical protein Q9M27_04550 [Mariprofundaceae bacterium]|nr:hypothetical protein [Mariprofundaceae bacterium]